MKKRLSSIDLFRGLCILWMIVGHTIQWWTIPGLFSEIDFIYNFIDAFGAAGFLFISGMSLTLSYHKKNKKIEDTSSYNYRHLRLEYFLRALFILMIGFIYNLIMAIGALDLRLIWQWFILQTIPISMMLMWPLLKLNKYGKFVIIVALLIVDNVLFTLISPFANNISSPYGILYYILYNGHEYSPILGFFPFFISGSIIGDILYDNYFSFRKDVNVKERKFLLKFSLPIILIGIGLILIGYIAIPPELFIKNQISWLFYAVGAQLIFFTILFSIEKLEVINIDKKYRFFYYFSYYSFSIFLIHYPMYFLFLGSLTLVQFFIIIPIVVLLIGLGLKAAYHIMGPWFSLKTQVSRLATESSIRIEKWRNKKKEQEEPITIKV